MSRHFRMTPARLVFCALCAGLGAATSSAMAQEVPSDAINDPKAAVLLRAGNKAWEENRQEDARALMADAWRLKQHWQIAANLGGAELALGRYRDAAEHLDYFLTMGTRLTEDERKNGLEALAKARAKVGTLKIHTSVSGAEVLVNGASIGKTPLAFPVYVEPGQVIVEARLAGYSSEQEKVELTAGSTRGLALQLRPLEPAVKEPKKQPPPAPKLPLASGAIDSGPNKGLLIAGGLVSALALGAGVGLFTAGSAKEGTNRQEDRAAAGLFLNAATTTFIAGGGVGVGTILYAIVTSGSKPGGRVEASFSVAPDAGGVLLQGRW